MAKLRAVSPPGGTGSDQDRIADLERYVSLQNENLDHLLRHNTSTGSGESSGGVITQLDLRDWARGRFTATYGASGRTATFAVTHSNGLPVKIECPSAGSITIRW